LRNVGDETYSIVDLDSQKVIGSIDQNYAFTTAHTGAIYLHEAETYFIENLDLIKRVAWARRSETDYFTQSMSDAQIRIDETDDEKTVVAAGAGIGGVTVTITIAMFKKVKFGSLDSLGFGKLELPPLILETTACWLVPPHSALARLRECGRVPLEGLLGVANALVGVLPLRVLCDAGDVGALVDSTQLGAPALFIYDKFSGGLGFSQRAYDDLEKLLRAARDLIGECACDDGCPSCVGSASKNYTYYDAGGEARARIPDKEAALVVLHDVLGLEPYVPRGAAPPEPIEPLPEGVEARVRRQLQRLKGI
jgi:DEAD/DEAH box helicase domain-containing protein